MTDPINAPLQRKPELHWAVTVFRNGEEVVTIETNCLSGREIGSADECAIRTAAAHLIAFIGDPPGGSGNPAPKAEASDLERAGDLVSEILADVDRANTRRHGITVATNTASQALAAVRREAASAERERCLDALHERLPYPTEACAIIRGIAANKPQAEASERARELIIHWAGTNKSAVELVAAAASAGWDAAEKALRDLAERHRISGQAGYWADYLSANKPQDITSACDPVALLRTEAARLAKSDDIGDQRRARGLQDAAKLLGSET